ncbi:MAG TPA: hypothetical protein EYG85_00370 [Crocinitomix sp.]|nr:hypothetical protein [Crocinitomix sp.]
MKTKIDKIKLLKRIIILLLLMSIVVFYVANKKLKQYGYHGVWDLITTYNSNQKLAKKVQAKNIQLQISDKDYNFLKQKRQEALDRGLMINKGNNYVDCKIKVNDDKVEGKLRLKGHMTDHLQGDKWSFRIKSDKKIMGMYRFSLQHPGTRNYVYEWIYHQLLKYEGIIYLKYDFVNVMLNDKNLGIYALEEHFGQHVLKRNNRPKGAIIRWNPQLYWEGRIDEFAGVYLDEQYKDYSSAYAEPYDKGKTLKDKDVLKTYRNGVKLLEEFRNGIKTTSQVFDIDKLAKFHAIIDLVGGHHSLDWSDVKLYYNSASKKIEPVGYESFSIRKSERIAGQQIYQNYDSVVFNYHAQLFKDPVFFKAYIKALERIANEKYLSQFIDKIQPELDLKIGVLAKEWAYRKFNFEGYFENIRLIKNNLNLPKPFHAFISQFNDSTIVVDIAPVSDFPIEIIKLKQGKNEYHLIEPFVLSPKVRDSYIKFNKLHFKGQITSPKGLIIEAKIPGYSKTFQIGVAPYAYFNKEDSFILQQTSIDTSFFKVKGKEVFLKNKDVNISKTVYIPKGYTLNLLPNQNLVLDADLIISGSFKSNGLTNHQAIITAQKGKIVLNKAVFQITNTSFNGIMAIRSNQSKLNFKNCYFYNLNKLITDNHSTIVIENCYGGTLKQLASLNQSELLIKNCVFKKGGQLLNTKSSNIKMMSSRVEAYQSLSNLDHISTFKTWSASFKEIDTVFTLKNASTVNTFGGEFYECDVAVKINKNSLNLKGESKQVIYNATLQNINQLVIKE